MGFFKKIFKPVSKVLDKIIPNEIKPALPYLAAFAPVFGPPGLQNFIGESMKRRMLTSGLMNIGAQLSQEGSEGDINLMSAGIGALSGAMTAPGASDYFSMRAGLAGEGTGLMSQAQKFGFDTLAKGSDFLKTGGIDTAGGTTAKLLSTEGAKVATLPAATATGDVMQAEARRLEKQAAIDEALAAAEGMADSAGRALAIRNAMTSYGFFTDEEIEDTIASAGYKAGGRVGFRFGGIDEAIENVQEETIEEGKEGIMTAAKEDPLLVEEYNKYVFDLMEQRPDAKPMSFGDFKRMIMSGMKDGGIMNAKRGLVDEPGGYAGELAGPLNNQIEGFNKQMMDEYLQGNYPEYEGERVSDFYNRPNFTDVNAVIKIIEMGGDFDDVRETLKIDISDERIKDFIKFDQEKKEKKSSENFYMKDGGLMNLGGKEMDLRGGGFVPIGKKERADDVPARLSKNEFVMTADAVRAAGGGSVNKGAKRMYDVMNKLEARA
jgi:hypothetical protein